MPELISGNVYEVAYSVIYEDEMNINYDLYIEDGIKEIQLLMMNPTDDSEMQFRVNDVCFTEIEIGHPILVKKLQLQRNHQLQVFMKYPLKV